jgi:two-component system sensor histidine kinase UhpB
VAALIVVWSGIWAIAARPLADASLWGFALGLMATACAVVAAGSYLLVRAAFFPLLWMSAALGTVHRGEHGLIRVEDSPVPNLAHMSGALVEMVERLEGESRSYTAQLLSSIEDERRRIGRELHDETSQTLAAALINLDLAQKSLEGAPPGVGQRVTDARELLQHCFDQIKLLVYDLRPAMLDDLGLVPALRWYIQSHISTTGLDVITDFEGAQCRLDTEVETALYRIAQEALSNVVHHAHASRATLRLECRAGYATLAVSDNGVGFEPSILVEKTVERPGMGLPSIRERVDVLGGRLSIQSVPGRGTRVYVVVPSAAEAA